MDWKDILGSLKTESDNDTTAETESSGKPEKTVAKCVTIFYEKKGRAGKPVTILAEFSGVNDDGIEELASRLKRKLATGGSCRGGEILIQGDRRREIRELLSNEGFKIKG